MSYQSEKHTQSRKLLLKLSQQSGSLLSSDKEVYCLCSSVNIVISSSICTVYTLKYSGTHPFFNRMCFRIKCLSKVFIRHQNRQSKFYFPIRCETCCLLKMTYRSHNVCNESELEFDFSVLLSHLMSPQNLYTKSLIKSYARSPSVECKRGLGVHLFQGFIPQL